ncbi:DUF488 domain-containing protein [Streptomyces sp. NPDC101118]|uniref:DUF488 domain-containing protein n=1 Tax=Streptomyces sp. NPDC101118 TaxID=3366109 RepID=UPI0038130F50
MNRSSEIRVARVYDPPTDGDGTRVLVDRLWPRGVSKADARVDEWPKDLTPSDDLRKEFHAGDLTDTEFRARYESELAAPEAAEALTRLRALAADGPVTLLTAVKDPAHSHVSVLLAHL